MSLPPASSHNSLGQPPQLHGAPLVIGITGPTKVDETAPGFAEAVARVLDDLYTSRGRYSPAVVARIGGLLQRIDPRSRFLQWLPRLIEERFLMPGRRPPGAVRWLLSALRDFIELPAGNVFERPMGLSHTPLMLLTSLAPGTDTLLVKLIRAWAKSRGVLVELVLPLPFPPDVYQQVSTAFNKNQNPETAREFVETLQTARYFIVRTPGETALDDAALAEKLRHECLGDSEAAKAARQARYKLASSYVANSCDLLLALATPEEIEDSAVPPSFRRAAAEKATTVTSQCIAAKRHGVGTPGMASTPSFSWADHGPVVVLPIRRDLVKGAHPNGDATKVHYPAALGRSAQSRTRGGEMFTGMCAELEAFNTACVAGGSDPTPREINALRGDLKLFCPHLGQLPKDASPADFQRAWQQESESAQALAMLAMRRRRLATLEGPASDKARNTLLRLFHLIFWAALLLHLYGHAPDFEVKFVLLFVSLVLAGLAGIFYWFFAKAHEEKHADDWRAVAEGLRVQMYWAAVGLPESAAANYLERMRSELDWIRNAIGAWSLPVARWPVDFAALSPTARLQRLRAVWRTWLIGQYKYFRKSSKKCAAEKHHAHTRGLRMILGAIALAASVLVLDVFLHHYSAHSLLLVTLGVLLLAGGMRLARSEKQLLLEHSLQYAAMRELMRAASRRVKQLLQEAAVHLAAGHHAAVDDLIAECQRLYFEIGRQALDENAEWLLLHRARPVEIPAGA